MGLRKKYFINSAVLCFGVMLSHVSIAESAEYHFGTGLLKFDYAEYNDSNVFLDGETGFIPGIVLKRKQHYQRSYTELVGQFHANTIQYNGQTQGGTPLQTESDAIIIDTFFRFGLYFDAARNHSPYVGLGYRYWLRNIHPGYDINGNPVAGLLEQYYWNYLLAGYEGYFSISDNVEMGFDIRSTFMLNGKMDVNFLGYNNYDDTQVNLGNEFGARFAIPIKIKIRKHSLIVVPYYEIIDIGKSNTVRVTSGGAATTTFIYEPRSETRNIGINITWVW
ncbi:MAG: hypothetical protein KAT06_12645 [Gammaproteobacteria bacterium]|nr:hypothetical protein [Gammaproteobacteria bacterium]